MPGGMRAGGSPPDTMEYYNLLGVSREAEDQEIKKAFRKKAMKEHPGPRGDAEKFKKISEAYEVLIDSEKGNYIINMVKKALSMLDAEEVEDIRLKIFLVVFLVIGSHPVLRREKQLPKH